MSRSYHQRHPTSHKGGCPRQVLDRDDDGELIYRQRKTKPYGRKDRIGWGEENYSRKYGEYMSPMTDRHERRKNKIRLQDIELDDRW